MKNILKKYSKEELERMALYVIIAAAVISAAVFGFYAPGFKRISNLGVFCKDLGEKTKDAKDKIANAERIKAGYQIVEKRMLVLQEMVPQDTDTSWILRTMEDVAKELRVHVEKIAPYCEAETAGTAKDKNPLYNFEFVEIKLNGGYHQIGKFINILEKKIGFFEIVSIKIEGDRDVPLQHNAEIKIKYLTLKQPLLE